jgi:hypothetical protein
MATYRYATKDLSINAAKAFIAALSAADGRNTKNSTILYAVLGDNKEWATEPTPVPPPDNEQHLSYDAHRNFIGGKRIGSEGASHVTDRYNWTSGTVYSMYRDIDTDMYDRAFYVLTEENNVYKCLYNNKGAASTVKPTGFSTLSFATSDGYIWKYMYTITLADANKWLTAEYMPVKTIVSGDGSTESDRQLAVQNSAVNGAIHVVETNSTGTGYKWLKNGIVTYGDSTEVRLSSTASTLDNYYNGSSIYIVSGTGAGQIRRIIDYVGSDKTVTVNTAFTTAPDIDSRVIISPTVTIVGDGRGALAYSQVIDATGAIANVTMINVGAGYTNAKALITANNDYGAGATANVVISPTGGHGRDPIRELYADKVMLSVSFNSEEGVSANGNGYIPSNTDFRSVTLLADPVLKCDANNNFVAVEHVANTSNSPSTLRLTTRLQVSYNNPSVSFSPGDIITTNNQLTRAITGQLEFVTDLSSTDRRTNALKNAVLAANGDVVYVRDDETETDTSFHVMYLNNVDSYSNYSSFVNDSVLLKSTSETPLAIVQEVKGPEANTYSGETLYMENIQKVTRDPEQVEDIKIILDF